MLNRLLIANRGEIAIRAIRAADELGIHSIAVYAHEDRYSQHRLKANEAYEIGEPGHPVRAYLDIDGLIAVATRVGADAIYPGYGFLAESADLAAACEQAGIIFVGPTSQTLTLAGNKVNAIEVARRIGLPTLGNVAPSDDLDALVSAGHELGFPLMVKAAAGGGGRGMRLITDPKDLRNGIEAAMREAGNAFGDPTVFLEKAVTQARHIEVQILGDGTGEVIHLRERDCSVQRRHQKVVEIAPAPNLDPAVVAKVCADAVTLAKELNYRSAGTVEFLVDPEGHNTFMEMNPRIQVEHTVTEEVTGVDLVKAQLEIAGGQTLASLGLHQDSISVHGFAMQCRITTEDPTNDFRPDAGRITFYRSPGGPGVRLDSGTAYSGAIVSAHFDSMLVKVTCRGATFAETVERARRAVGEFRIRGVATNIGFLLKVLSDPDFMAAKLTTSFIADHPELLQTALGIDPVTGMLNYLSDVTVNRPNGKAPKIPNPASKLPAIDLSSPVPPGSKQLLEKLGAKGYADQIRAGKPLCLTDTTFRDAHQSLLATRIRTLDLLDVAPYVARMTPQLFSVECWGGATYDVALRFLSESPWDRLERLREAMPNICLQMLLRGQNLVGYSPYPTSVIKSFVREAVRHGLDVFRIFDSLNEFEQMVPAIDAALETGALVEGTLCYTGDLASPREDLYTIDYYLNLAQRLVDAGVHILCVKDMAGLLKAPAGRILIRRMREQFDVPIHLHTHDTAGGQLATYLAASTAGVDIVDGASSPMAGTTSQPPLSAIVAATDNTERETGVSIDALTDLEPYWATVRELYAPFEAGLPGPTGRVYEHEIPGGQLSNLRTQAAALGLGDRFEDIEKMYAAADRILGRIVKVTPSSKVVGDLALQMVAQNVDPHDFQEHPAKYDIPDSVLGFLAGELGTPAGGWPEPFRTKALGGRKAVDHTVHVSSEVEAKLEQPGCTDILDELIFPGPTKDYRSALDSFGPITNLPTDAFFYGLESGKEVTVCGGPGVTSTITLEAVGEPDEAGYRMVMCRVNGQLRSAEVLDKAAATEAPTIERADPSDPTHIGSPFDGTVTVRVAEGDQVAAGDVVATIEAMKMETAITAPNAGRVARIAVRETAAVRSGDLILVIK